jgi:hypothetical protein
MHLPPQQISISLVQTTEYTTFFCKRTQHEVARFNCFYEVPKSLLAEKKFAKLVILGYRDIALGV